mmetsp:Transcript_71137/g.158128  ORF Transcript_71137/g.158128 Transcript_71137/m.158128 type:complete len:217 (-) Transcript_71137:386-1036(-)
MLGAASVLRGDSWTPRGEGTHIYRHVGRRCIGRRRLLHFMGQLQRSCLRQRRGVRLVSAAARGPPDVRGWEDRELWWTSGAVTANIAGQTDPCTLPRRWRGDCVCGGRRGRHAGVTWGGGGGARPRGTTPTDVGSVLHCCARTPPPPQSSHRQLRLWPTAATRHRHALASTASLRRGGREGRTLSAAPPRRRCHRDAPPALLLAADATGSGRVHWR